MARMRLVGVWMVIFDPHISANVDLAAGLAALAKLYMDRRGVTVASSPHVGSNWLLSRYVFLSEVRTRLSSEQADTGVLIGSKRVNPTGVRTRYLVALHTWPAGQPYPLPSELVDVLLGSRAHIVVSRDRLLVLTPPRSPGREPRRPLASSTPGATGSVPDSDG